MVAADTAQIIEVGDFITSTLIRSVTGFALRRTTIGGRRAPITGWLIHCWSDREDFIDDRSAMLLAKSESWWERWEAEHEQPAIETQSKRANVATADAL